MLKFDFYENDSLAWALLTRMEQQGLQFDAQPCFSGKQPRDDAFVVRSCHAGSWCENAGDEVVRIPYDPAHVKEQLAKTKGKFDATNYTRRCVDQAIKQLKGKDRRRRQHDVPRLPRELVTRDIFRFHLNDGEDLVLTPPPHSGL